MELPLSRSAAPARAFRLPPLWPLLLALGPSVIGLCADNDAGGMLSYVVTGASHGLALLLPALVVLVLPTVFVMWVAARVGASERRPYSRVLAARVGAPLARVDAVVLYALNGVLLVTEFVGMALALSVAGLPRPLAVAAALGLVVAMTSANTYPRLERLLVWVALGNLAFVPAALLVHHPAGALAAAFSPRVPHGWFLLLALAGNTMAPWMIYWQENAVAAGAPRTSRQRIGDLATGQAAMLLMAGAVLVLGAVTPGSTAAWSSPLAWILHDGGRVAGILFAIGLFDAGLLAACTISLASLWTLREAVGGGVGGREQAPNAGAWRLPHIATLAAAAGAVMWPHLSPGAVAVWAQALEALWMPVSLALLAAAAGGRAALGPAARALLILLAAGYLALALAGLGL